MFFRERLALLKLSWGRIPFWLQSPTRKAVPHWDIDWEVRGALFSLLIRVLITWTKRLPSATCRECWPLTANALRFLDPMTAPIPAPPTDKKRSLTILARGRRRSPAGPMAAIKVSRLTHWSSRFFLNNCSVSTVERPQYSKAGTSLTLSSIIERITGLSALPSMITISNPANLSSAPKCPRILAQARVPVREDLVMTLQEAPVIAPVPTRGPEIKISLFSGARGSVCGATSSIKVFTPRPRPPKNRSARSGLIFSILCFPSVRFTLRQRPIQPFISLLPVT